MVAGLIFDTVRKQLPAKTWVIHVKEMGHN